MKPMTKVVTQSITCIVMGHCDLALGKYHWDLEPDYNYVHCWHVGKGELYNWLYQSVVIHIECKVIRTDSEQGWLSTWPHDSVVEVEGCICLNKDVTTWTFWTRVDWMWQGPRNRACNYKRIQGTHLHAPRANPHSTRGLDIRSSGRNNGTVIFRI